MLTALVAVGALLGFGIAARVLDRGADPLQLAACGLLAGIPAISAVVFSAPTASTNLLRAGAFLIGLGGGLFSAGTLTAAMYQVRDGMSGRMLGAWGTVQALAAGSAIALSGVIRDGIAGLAAKGADGRRRQVRVKSILGKQFADVSMLGSPEQVTRREEDRICAYYGGGYLYATPARGEPLI